MTVQNIILNRLLDKFENSKHLSEPGISPRRVMLKVQKKDLPEYRYEDASTRDQYNDAATSLASKNLVTLEWVKGRPLLDSIVLNLDQIMECYDTAGRTHPQTLAETLLETIQSGLSGVTTPWILSWKSDVCTAAATQMKVPSFCKAEDTVLQDLLCSFREYDSLSTSITIRAFSIRCFSDTKYFERNIRELFLRIARKYDPDLSLSCEENELGERDQLAFLGIYARPELYELSGNCCIHTHYGELDLAAAGPNGIAIPSTMVESIASIDLSSIRCVTFIENKTNYDEYIATAKAPEELVVYHGGFLSPQKRRLFALISTSVPASAEMRFWADLDMGGFRMFQRLQSIIPTLTPLYMSGEYVDRFHCYGLARPKAYLSTLQTALENNQFPLFQDTIKKILIYGVTIEQEVFLK